MYYNYCDKAGAGSWIAIVKSQFDQFGISKC